MRYLGSWRVDPLFLLPWQENDNGARLVKAVAFGRVLVWQRKYRGESDSKTPLSGLTDTLRAEPTCDHTCGSDYFRDETFPYCPKCGERL